MQRFRVSLLRYERPYESVKRVVQYSDGLKGLSPDLHVFIKPNIVFWTKECSFPKWGVITTSRVVEDIVRILKEMGITKITIGEGIVTFRPKDRQTPMHAFKSLGYLELKKRYGIKVIDVFDRPFKKIELSDGLKLNFNVDALESDLLINLPVLKTHAQAVVSLGIKNLKGLIDINSRKRCHGADPIKDLNFNIARLSDKMPPMFTLIDGIFTLEQGPGFDGKARRSDILIASDDVLSADMVGAKVLGYEPKDVPHLLIASQNHKRPADLSDIDVVGERLEDLISFHEYDFPYGNDNNLPLPLVRMGIKGLSYPKYDSTLCTYCSHLNGAIIYSIMRAWKGRPWDDVEILTGKIMRPSGKMKKTILVGKCMYSLNRDDPSIREMIAVKGCPPDPEDVINALHKAGIEVEPDILKNLEKYPCIFMKKYRGRKEFDEDFFTFKEY